MLESLDCHVDYICVCAIVCSAYSLPELTGCNWCHEFYQVIQSCFLNGAGFSSIPLLVFCVCTRASAHGRGNLLHRCSKNICPCISEHITRPFTCAPVFSSFIFNTRNCKSCIWGFILKFHILHYWRDAVIELPFDILINNR